MRKKNLRAAAVALLFLSACATSSRKSEDLGLMLSFYPEEDLEIAVLTNRGGLWADAIEKAVAREVLGLPEPRVLSMAGTHWYGHRKP